MAYNLRAIRKLLSATFSDDELSQFCYDFAEFRPVYEQFSSGMGKDQKIQRLIEYCERKVLLDRLLEILKTEAKGQFDQFAAEIGVSEPKASSNLAEIGANEQNTSLTPAEIKHLQELITINTRRLQHLQLQAAKYGSLSVPPYIAIEIEDLEKELPELHQKLKGLQK